MKTIAVGYDGSEASRRALERAVELAQALDSKLLVITVAELLPAMVDGGFPGNAMGMVTPGVPAEPDEREARRELQEAQTILSGRDVRAEYVSVVDDPAEGIIEQANAHDAELIAVGTRHPGFLDRLFGGDVGESLSRRSRRDVLIVD